MTSRGNFYAGVWRVMLFVLVMLFIGSVLNSCFNPSKKVNSFKDEAYMQWRHAFNSSCRCDIFKE